MYYYYVVSIPEGNLTLMPPKLLVIVTPEYPDPLMPAIPYPMLESSPGGGDIMGPGVPLILYGDAPAGRGAG